MSTAGRIFAGAVRGASKYGLDQMEQRQEEEREIRKAKLLEDLRMSTAKELATFEYNLKSGEADKNFSSADEDYYILRNSQGKEVGRRQLTATEKRERALALDKDALEVENVRDQIRSRRVGDAREARYTEASIANMRADRQKAQALDADAAGDANSLGQGLVNRYKGFLGEGASKIDEQVAFDLAQEALDYAATTKGGKTAAEDYYLRKLKQLKAGVDNTKYGKVRFVE